MKLAVVGAVLALGGSGITVTTLPRPGFKAPANTKSSGHMLIVSSEERAPSLGSGIVALPKTAPLKFRGTQPTGGASQAGRTFAFYGGRYLLAFSSQRFHYGFDFENYARPPRFRPGERELVFEELRWAREADGVLYVENAHWTYARSSYGRNAYITAIDLKTKKKLWRSAALVANADTFVLAGKYLVTGYGFTAEPDYLYLLDRRTGRTFDRLKVPSAPERITRDGDVIRVRTYDRAVVVRLEDI